MSRTIEFREPHAAFDLVIPDDLPEVYADDLSHVMMGIPISKVIFHSVSSSANIPANGAPPRQLEVREAVLQMTMPTLALVNFAKNVLAVASQNDALVKQGLAQYHEHFLSTMKAQPVTPATREPAGKPGPA